MEKKLTEYIHFYIGCEVSLLNTVTGEWSKWRKLSFNDCNLIVNNAVEARLKLRPLPSMTEEEAEEKRQYLMSQNYDGLEFFDTFPMHNAYEMKWILSKGFDIFQLIEAGLAIDKTKL